MHLFYCNHLHVQEKIKARLRLVPLLLVLLLLTSCGKTPFDPYSEAAVAEKLAFFPLKNGYSVDYSFEHVSQVTANNYSYTYHRVEGIFRLQVITSLKLDSLVYFKLRSSFFVDNDSIFDSILDETVVTVKKNYVKSTDYDVMFSNDTLFYIDNAPSFERLSEGEKSIMMLSPIASGGDMKFRLFDFPGNFEANNTLLVAYSTSEDAARYEQYGWGGQFGIPAIGISFVKNIGATGFTYSSFYGLTINFNITTKFSLLTAEE